MENLKRFNKMRLASLTLIGLITLQAEANIISDGSAGFFHPTSNTILDLSGPNFPQYSNVLIDSGITVQVLSGGLGISAQFLAQNDFLLNGIIDAGNGILNISAGNSIVLGTNSRINAGSISLIANNLNIPAGSIIAIGNPDANLQPKSAIPPRDDLSLGNLNAALITYGSAGDLTLHAGSTISNGNKFNLIGNSVTPGGSITVTQPSFSVPEPKTLLLMLTGLTMLTYRRKWPA